MAEVFDSVTRTVSIMAGKSTVMDDVAGELADLARGFASNHSDADSTFARSIRVEKAGNGKDRLVVATDPLAIPKELGHVVISHGELAGYVKGQHSLGKAVAAIHEVS
jgi:hypothetical protein